MAIPPGDYRCPSRREHFVYRVYDAQDRLLYVGCSMRPEKRWREHLADPKDWTAQAREFRLVGPYNYDTARAIEREAIRTERPLHNFTLTRRRQRQAKRAALANRIAELAAAGMADSEATRQAFFERTGMSVPASITTNKALAA